MPKELWTDVCNIVEEVVSKTVSKEKKCKKVKWLSEVALQMAEKKRSERQRRKRKIYPSECRTSRDKEAFLRDQCKEIEENNRMGKTRVLFKEIKRYQRNISCKDELDIGQKWYGPNRSRRY